MDNGFFLQHYNILAPEIICFHHHEVLLRLLQFVLLHLRITGQLFPFPLGIHIEEDEAPLQVSLDLLLISHVIPSLFGEHI